MCQLFKEDLYALLKICGDAGLVHFTTNRTLSDNIVLCNCCKCCCGYLRNKKRVREAGIQFTETTNFVSRVDKETCIGCGECVEYCQLEALQLSGDTVNVNQQYCLECGACVSKCPTQSLTLVRISHKKPPEPKIRIVGSGV